MPSNTSTYQPRGVRTAPRLSDFKFTLSDKYIAQAPTSKRDNSRMLVVNRADGTFHDGKFTDIIKHLSSGDCLVINVTRVFPARLAGYKEKTEADIEVFLLRRLTDDLWEVLVKPARKVRTGNTIHIGNSMYCEVIDNTTSGGRVVRFHYEGDFNQLVEKHGKPPLPPYIKREPNLEDKERYQTIYARDSGSIAAPTAGLHFTPELIDEIRSRGVRCLFVTLHVGLDTFRPVTVSDPCEHVISEEYGVLNAV